MSEFQEDLTKIQAYLKTDDFLRTMGVDIAECDTNTDMAAFATKIMEVEERKLNGTYGEEIDYGDSNQN